MSLSWPVFVDRCLGGQRMKPALVKAGWTVLLHDERFDKEAPDTVWLPEVAASGHVILTRDKHMRRRPDELQAIVESGARIVFVGFEGNMQTYLTALLAGASRLQHVFDTYPTPTAVKLRREGRVEIIQLLTHSAAAEDPHRSPPTPS